jgi:hypothetical protein
LDCDRFNHHLTEWLIEYNFNRPHQKLDYLTPIEHIKKELVRIRGLAKVSPMWSARTGPCYLFLNVIEAEPVNCDKYTFRFN